MKRRLLCRAILASLALIWLVLPGVALGKPTTAAQAQSVVKNWLLSASRHLGVELNQKVKDVKTFLDTSGRPLYFAVNLEPEGLVFVPGDDLVEPIVGFLPKGVYLPSDVNPLGALVSRDLPGRVTYVRQMQDQAAAQGHEFVARGKLQRAQEKWVQLEKAGGQSTNKGLDSISDVRVAPLIQTTWDQGSVGGNYCYNYFTPNHYICGCLATALGQLLFYHQQPTVGVGTASFQVTVDGVQQARSLRGGDGSGGPYNWSQMPLSPGASTQDYQRQAIGALTSDTGVSCNMAYTANESTAYDNKAQWALTNVFKYANAVWGNSYPNDLPSTEMYNMINPNLDAQFPVLLSISGSVGGHEIVADGYGFDTDTMYHHLNMGWSGQCDVWYNLPNIDSNNFGGPGPFDTIYDCTYNIYPSGSGEIISGRVADADGYPVSGAAVTASRSGGGTYNATTNDAGIYAFTHLPPNSSYTISVTGYDSQTASTGASTNNSTTVGNVWGVDFNAQPPVTAEIGVDGLITCKKALSYSSKGPKYSQSSTFKRGKTVYFLWHVSDDQTSASIAGAYVDLEIYDPYDNLAASGSYLGPTDDYGLSWCYWTTSKALYPGSYYVVVTGVYPPDPSQGWDGAQTEWPFYLK